MLANRASGTAADQAAYVQLKTRFDKGEKTGTQPHLDIAAEHGAKQRLHEVDQVTDADVFVDHHPFELVKGVLMRRIHVLVAKDAPGRDHSERWSESLHSPDLNRRRVCA